MTPVERRDPEKTYNRMDAAKLASLTPNWSWSAYFQAVGVRPAAVNVAQPKFFEAVSREIQATPLSSWKTYLRWKLLNDAAPRLSKAFVDADFDFYGKVLQGTPENEARWKRCVVAADGELGQALGKSYVKEYFPPEAKAAADKMVKNLVAALRDDLKTLPWMSEATRQKALEKLAAFRPKIGYPDVWRDYSSLTIDRGPFVLNVQRAEEFEFRRQLKKVGRPVDREDWQMTPPEVNAYYDAQLNEIVFPAGILQPPFFDPKADDAVNYGAMGGVIGHELTHGFDDEGRKFDARGNMSDWWTAEDARNYEARAKCVESQFAAYTFDGQNVNGKLVLGESIADLGGLSIAHRAYRGTLAGKPEPAPIDGLSADQRFFLAWARVWSANVRPELAKLLMNTNPHPLPEFRANGAPSNIPAFAAAFSCKSGDPMVRADVCRSGERSAASAAVTIPRPQAEVTRLVRGRTRRDPSSLRPQDDSSRRGRDGDILPRHGLPHRPRRRARRRRPGASDPFPARASPAPDRGSTSPSSRGCRFPRCGCPSPASTTRRTASKRGTSRTRTSRSSSRVAVNRGSRSAGSTSTD